MSVVPAEIAGIGSTAAKLRVSPGFDPLKAQVGPDEYFLLSRIDGTQTLREVILSTGLPVDRAIAIVSKLRSIGALLLPGETSAPAPVAPPRPTPPAAPPSAASPPARDPVRAAAEKTPAVPITPPHGIAIARTATPMVPMAGGKLPARPATPAQGIPVMPATPASAAPTVPTPPPAISRAPTPMTPMAPMRTPAKPAEPPKGPDIAGLPNPTDLERAALAEFTDLDLDTRVRLLAMARLVDGGDPWALLGVPRGADAKALKRAYFKLSKEVHPDRFYGKKTGSFAERLSVVFEAVSRAYAKLTTPEKSKPSGKHQAVSSEQPQTPGEYAAELFDRACALEVGGDALGAMKLFAAAVRIDPQTRYLRRAASCALAAEQPKTALEYAKKAQTQAPNDPSAARLLAFAFKATGKYADAEEVLVMAMAIKSENDVLTAELRNDLAEVRRLLSG